MTTLEDFIMAYLDNMETNSKSYIHEDLTPLSEYELQLRWYNQSTLSSCLEPSDMIYDYKGTIIGIDDEEEEHTVGAFRAYYVDIERAKNNDEDVFDVFDEHSQTMTDYMNALYNLSSFKFSDLVKKVMGKQFTKKTNLLVIDRIEILSAFRGGKIGLQVLANIMKRLSHGSGLIAIKPYPLQFENRIVDKQQHEREDWSYLMDFESLTSDWDTGLSKLQEYYSQVGFVLVPGSDVMIFDTSRPIPVID